MRKVHQKTLVPIRIAFSRQLFGKVFSINHVTTWNGNIDKVQHGGVEVHDTTELRLNCPLCNRQFLLPNIAGIGLGPCRNERSTHPTLVVGPLFGPQRKRTVVLVRRA